MKKRMTILTLLILSVAMLGVVALTACKKTPADTDTVTESGIYISALPKQYYVVGEELSLNGGEITVIVTKKGTGTNNAQDGQKTVPMTDPKVSVSYPGTAIAGEVKTAVVSYGEYKASFKYYVTEESNAIDSVVFAVEEGGKAPSDTYAVSTIRTNADFNDLIVTVNYADKSKSPYLMKVSTKIFGSIGLSLSGFDVTTVGKGTMTLSYLASDYVLDYSVVNDDWAENTTLLKSLLVTDYLIGDSFDGGNTKLHIKYNSGKTESPLITADNLTGFSTAVAGMGFTATVKDVEGENTFTYNVYDPTDTTDMTALVLYHGTSFMNVRDEMTYAEYLNDNEFRLIIDDGHVTVNGASEGMSVKNKADGSIFDEAAYNAALTKGQIINLEFCYRGNVALTEEVTFTVTKKWLNTVISGWNDNYILQKDASFDFGEATLKMVFDDGTESIYDIQEVYEKQTAEERAFNINDSSAQQVFEIDTSVVGVFEGAYYVAVQGEVTVNGESFDHNNTGRLYLKYTVSD